VDALVTHFESERLKQELDSDEKLDGNANGSGH
jgi:hypothetical protein